MNAAKVVEDLKQRFPNEPEYIQAVSQVLPTIEEEYNKHPEFEKANLIERLCIPDRVCEFRITWVDDKGNVQTNMGYRIQPRFRADFQELSDNTSYGWCKGWFRLLSPW